MTRTPKRRPRVPRGQAVALPVQPEVQVASLVTAATHRPVVPTGTVEQVRRLLPPVPPLEADDLDITEYHQQFVLPHVQSASAFVDRSGVARKMNEWHVASKDKRGCKEKIPFKAVLVALWLIATTGGNLWMTNVRDVLFHKMSPEARALLGVTYPNRPTHPHDQARDEKTSEADRLWDEASERAVARTFARMLRTIDPSVLPKGRVRPYNELLEKARPLTVAEQQELQYRLDWVSNRLLETAFKTLPRRIRRKYKGSACIDGTKLPLYSRGVGKDKPYCSSDPDGGYHGRQDGHGEPGDLRDATWALEVSLLVAVDCHHGTKQWLPALPLAMTTDRPGVDLAGAARRIFGFVSEAGYPVRWLAGDLLYTDQKPEKFQNAARSIGYKPVLGYGPKHHGRQGTHPTGMLMVEGGWFCPAMPENLIDATVTRRTKDKDQKPLISHEQWRALIDGRGDFAMSPKEKPDKSGKERLGCPASGANPRVACPLKKKSEQERKTKQRGGRVADARITVNPPAHFKNADGEAALDVCKQQTLTIHPSPDDTNFDKYRQELRYGTVQQLTTYVRLRQAQEGLHGFAKTHATQALDDPEKRLVRGKAAQTLFAALLLAAASIAKIRTFLHTAETDTAGDRWVEREPLISALRTPPGDEAPDPPPGQLPAAA